MSHSHHTHTHPSVHSSIHPSHLRFHFEVFICIASPWRRLGRNGCIYSSILGIRIIVDFLGFFWHSARFGILFIGFGVSFPRCVKRTRSLEQIMTRNRTLRNGWHWKKHGRGATRYSHFCESFMFTWTWTTEAGSATFLPFLLQPSGTVQ